MNNTVRRRVKQISEGLTMLKDQLEEIYDAECEKRDNMEENFSGTDRFADLESACDSLEGGISSIDDAINSLEDAIS